MQVFLPFCVISAMKIYSSLSFFQSHRLVTVFLVYKGYFGYMRFFTFKFSPHVSWDPTVQGKELLHLCVF